MSKVAIIVLVIGIIIVGSAVAVLFTSTDQPVELTDESETSIPEPEVSEGRDLQISLKDGLVMRQTP